MEAFTWAVNVSLTLEGDVCTELHFLCERELHVAEREFGEIESKAQSEVILVLVHRKGGSYLGTCPLESR